MALLDNLASMEERLKVLESFVMSHGQDIQNAVTTKVKKSFKLAPQSETTFGLHTALCVSTEDPLKQNRVRYFSPLFHDPNTPVEALPFASPVSSFGGFDDSGCTWVPPAGSTLCMIFEAGHRSAPYYLGTTWHRDRGADGQHNWGYNIAEYYSIHEGHRKGFLTGGNNGSQVLPPWNTESYNGIDVDSTADYDAETDAQKKRATYPNIYGFKTPQKHMLKMVDGDYKCEQKNKRVELMSSLGNWMIFKDDHLHEFKPQGTDQTCEDSVACKGKHSSKLATPSNSPYFKNQNELRPWHGPGTPQNNHCNLKQSGIQLLSISGHSFVMDDSVSDPSGSCEWERGTKSFDFGCNNLYTGKTFWVSATGHRIEMNDEETKSNRRSQNNGIHLVSACGNRIDLNDHSRDQKVSGTSRGIKIETTSQHLLDMRDADQLAQGSPRKEGGVPSNKAKNAYIRLRSGYGLEIMMSDAKSQQQTQKQYIQVYAPQKNNKKRGAHIFRMQEKKSGPGQVYLRVGGNYVITTYDNSQEVVGQKGRNPANKTVFVSKNTLINTAKVYINKAQLHQFVADKAIILSAGHKPVWPVLVLTPAGVMASSEVFASSAPGCNVSTYQMLPYL